MKILKSFRSQVFVWIFSALLTNACSSSLTKSLALRPVGLYNLYGSCYLNATTQFLRRSINLNETLETSDLSEKPCSEMLKTFFSKMDDQSVRNLSRTYQEEVFLEDDYAEMAKCLEDVASELDSQTSNSPYENLLKVAKLSPCTGWKDALARWSYARKRAQILNGIDNLGKNAARFTLEMITEKLKSELGLDISEEIEFVDMHIKDLELSDIDGVVAVVLWKNQRKDRAGFLEHYVSLVKDTNSDRWFFINDRAVAFNESFAESEAKSAEWNVVAILHE